MRWPPMREGSAAPIAERRNGLIVVEGSVDPDLSRELLAVGRFLQQRLWERAGVLPAVHTAEHEVTESGASRRERANWVVRVGLLERDLRAGDSLWAGPEGGAFALRGSSPSGLQLAYSIEPFFQDVPLAGRTWSVD